MTGPRKRVTVVAMTVLIVGAGCASGDGAQAKAPTPSAPASSIPGPGAPGFDTPDGTVELACEGRGDTPVVLLAGGIDPVSTWDGLVGKLGEDTLVCRAAFTTTSGAPGPAPITGTRRADALAAALTSSDLAPPYVLVGHSLGGLTVREFGARHGELLGGALLIDPTTPLVLRAIRDDLSGWGWDVDAIEASADADVTWPPVPLVVLSHDPATKTVGPKAVEDLWTEGQRAYAELSPLGRQESIAGAGHYVYLDAPDRVVEAIEGLATR